MNILSRYSQEHLQLEDDEAVWKSHRGEGTSEESMAGRTGSTEAQLQLDGMTLQ